MAPEDDPITTEPPPGPLDAALREAFGARSAAIPGGSGPVLDALERSVGVTSHLLLRDEPDAPSPVVDPRPAGVTHPPRYQVLGEIARGGMGVVLKGRDPDLGRDVAMKVLHPSHAGNSALIQRFIEEAQVGGQLQHPGILPVYELGLDADRRPYFTMRLVKGRTLAALLEERPGPGHDLGRFLGIFQQVCQAVAYAHARGVIHRDLKPANIMVGAFGEVQVVDWGLAKVLRQGAETSQAAHPPGEDGDEGQVATVRSTGGDSHSQAGSILGTPAYMSPEQARGEVDGLNEQADVFSLGAILCEILSGRPPYSGDRPKILADAAQGRLDEGRAALDACGAEGELIRLAGRSLDPDRAIRPRNAGILAREVGAFLETSAERARVAEIAAAQAHATAAAERKAKRKIVALASLLTLALLATAAFAIQAKVERGARAEQTISDVAALYWKANWFRDQARKLPPDQLAPWAQALAQVRKTAEILDPHVPRSEVRENLRQLIAELKAEEERIQARIRQGKQVEPPRQGPANP